MDSNETINILKTNVVKPGSEFLSKLENRLSVADLKSLGDAKVFYEDEDIIVNGKSSNVRRLFVRKESADNDGVGWIINEDITSCMARSYHFVVLSSNTV